MASSRSAVIIGGGITGVLTARELVGAGWRVTLLEAAHLGAGSSSRTAAGIRQQFSTPETVRGMRYAVRAYGRLPTEDGVPPLVQNGYLFLYADEAPWRLARERVLMQREAGLVEVQALAPAELAARFPWVDPEAVLGGTFCPTDGFLRPEVVYQEGARDARARGVELVQGAPVISAERAGGRLVAVDTPKGRFSADLFFDCTNAWTRRLARVLGAEELPVDPLKRYLWFIARGDAMDRETFARMPLVVSPSGVYCRPESPESLLVGWAHDATPEPDFGYDDQDRVEPAFSHNTGIDTVPYEAWMHLAEVLPPIGEFAGITATTSGYYGSTPDHNPFFGYDRTLANLVHLVGFSGHGAMFGPFTAAVGAALAEAGRDLEAVDLEGERVSLASFHIGRSFGVPESMVI